MKNEAGSTFSSANEIDTLGIPLLPMFDLIEDELAIFNDMEALPWEPYPVRLSSLWFAVCLKGHARLRLSLREISLGAGQMLVVLPDQILEREEVSDDIEGMLIAVSRKAIDRVIPSVESLSALMLEVLKQPCLTLTNEEIEEMKAYHTFLRRKVRMKDNCFRAEITQGLLTALFYEVYAIYHHASASVPVGRANGYAKAYDKGAAGSTSPAEGASDSRHSPKLAAHSPTGTSQSGWRKEELFRRFVSELPANCRRERSVAFYAHTLCVSPKYLTSVVREISGRTASDWIDEYVGLEAKVLLRTTDLTIQEISQRLHFANQSFFGKYFRRVAGVSPKEYRLQ